MVYQSEQLFPFFNSLLPEGWKLEKDTRAQNIDERDGFAILVNNWEGLSGAVSVRQVSEN